MTPWEWWRGRRVRREAERDETEQLLRDTYLFEDTAEYDVVAQHFESARCVLLGLLPPAPLAPPASRLWREIEADLACDPEFMLPVLDALREGPQT